jgi:hyperosmotically inducible periplasmic protein
MRGAQVIPVWNRFELGTSLNPRGARGRATEPFPMSHSSSSRLYGKSHWLCRSVRGLALQIVLGAVSLGCTLARYPGQNPSQPARQPGGAAGEESTDQPEQSAKDRELARRIRRAIVTDKSLSTYAHNIKIVAKDNIVVLKGPVRSENEKIAVNAKAVQIAGANNVRDQLTVEPKAR